MPSWINAKGIFCLGVSLLFAQEHPKEKASPEGFRSTARRVVPAVVSVCSSAASEFSEDEGVPFWGLRGKNLPRRFRERALGSGVVVSADGYILTNDHVISQVKEICIRYSDGREYPARRVGSDAGTDIALLKIEARDLSFLELADSSTIDVGDIVLAVGNPFGVGKTVTMGIVSALDRRGIAEPEKFEDFIQTDAAINPGDSGGALVTARGELIGINTALLSDSGGSQGIGFAVPSNLARHTMTQILKNGRVIRGWIGVSTQAINSLEASAFGLYTPTGILVNAVVPGGPAAKSGMKRGEIILEFNGERLRDPSDLKIKVSLIAPGSTVSLKLFRDGVERTLSLVVGELPSYLPTRDPLDEEPITVDGLQLEMMTPQLARLVRLPGSAGVVIVNVKQGSAGAVAGLREGDVILEADRKPAAAVQAVEETLRNRKSRPLILLINRSGKTVFVVLGPHRESR